MANSLPRLCLTMIVKNESKIIKRCLDSVKDYIDYWVIVDTGSTDDTKSIIKKELSSIPGELHESEFVNFSHNRNEALDYSRGKSDFLLLMDADLELKVLNKEFKNDLLSPEFHAYSIYECDSESEGSCAGFKYHTKKLINNSLNWEYVGVTHEYIDATESDINKTNVAEGIWLHNRYDGGSKHDKFERDARLLEESIKEDPNNPRTMFYLGQTYFDLYMKNTENDIYLDRAISWYEKRVEQKDSWNQEIFISLVKIADCLSIKKDVLDLSAYLRAYEFMPSRLEPIHTIVKYCRDNEFYRIGYIIGKFALDNITPLPKDALFVDGDVYMYKLMDEVAICASWSGDNKTSCEIIESILPVVEGYVSEENEERIKDNLKICRKILLENV
tara:strand:+ start:417 stop:1580 length:1164 start_codon:yes stop_codon:yes gene_type:complete